MQERIFDLNGRDNCVTATIKVADQAFRVNRVVTGVRVLYSNYLMEMGRLMQEVGKIDAEDASCEEDTVALRAKVDDFSRRKGEVYDEILTLLLTRNGYVYDKAWWEANTDEMDVRAFIDACVSKDAPDTKKK